jgi:hypothetical protein
MSSSKNLTQQIQELFLNYGSAGWHIMRHIDQCLREGIAKSTREYRVKQPLYVLAQSLTYCRGDHAETLEDGGFVDGLVASTISS